MHSLFSHYLLLPLLCTTCATASVTAFAQDELIKPRVEINGAAGSDRSTAMMEFWVPFMQDINKGRVLYGDYRMVGDNQDSREFNVGIGYRQIIDIYDVEGIAGLHGWFDRRHTPRGSTFNQLTAGVEWFHRDYELKLNGYMPLNNKETHIQSNPNGTNGRFVGNQIVVNTNQVVQEEALKGLDFEVGLNLPFFKSSTDSTRIYGAIYHFEGDKAEDVSGWRTRFTSDITSNIEIGARFQRDDVRGSQGFLEATIRFPFGNKRSHRAHGLKARLDESPERDIDIVSNEAIIDDGFDVTLINLETDEIQNVIHVDNTSGGGDGSAETPYNTLAAAQAAAGDNALIYVHRGDGTNTGQANGITLDDTGQMLVGAGVNLSFSNGRFSTSNDQGLSSNIIITADSAGAPLITNSGGQGVRISADQTYISGITVDGATSHGIYAVNSSGATWQSIEIRDVTVQNNMTDGVRVEANGAGAEILSVNVEDITSTNNRHGALIYALNSGQLGTVEMNNLTLNSNVDQGLFVYSLSSGQIDDISVRNITANTNQDYGVYVLPQNAGVITSAIFDGVTANNNTRYGLRFQSDGVNAILSSIEARNVSTSGAVQDTGIFFYASNNGQITRAVLEDSSSTANNDHGVWIYSLGGGQIDGASLQNVTATNNRLTGVQVDYDGGPVIADLGGGTLGSTGGNQIHSNTGVDLFVDLNGGELKAENNWWGVSTGLAGGNVTLSVGSTVDADPFLAVAPN